MKKEQFIKHFKQVDYLEVIYACYCDNFHLAKPRQGRQPRMISYSTFVKLSHLIDNLSVMYNLAVKYYVSKFDLLLTDVMQTDKLGVTTILKTTLIDEHKTA